MSLPLTRLVTFEQIVAARERIAPVVLRTSQVKSQALSGLVGHDVFLKREHHQVTGAFKLRGATNAVLCLDPAERAKGVTAASTGNHGRALSYAAQQAGSRAVICMSKLVPQNKVRAIEALGAEARIVGRSQDEAQAEVDRLVREEGMVEVPPFDRAEVIAGQGTIGLEMLQDAPEMDAVLVPLSGGGLIAGVALAIKTGSPKTKVIGVSMERGAAMIASLAAGRPTEVEELETLADSLGGGLGPNNRYTYEMVSKYVDETLTVSEQQIAAAIRFAYAEEGEVIEGAAAVGIAALVHHRYRPDGACCVLLSGKNIDMEVHRQLISGTHPAFGEGG